MRRLMIAALALAPALLLGACGGGGATDTAATMAAGTADVIGVSPPAEQADKTVIDEQALLSAELAYKAARIAVETGVDAGAIRGATAARIAELDNCAYGALGVARGAYRAGNAQSYKNALSEARAAIAGLLSLTGKTGG